MSPFEQNRIKHRIYQLRVENFNASRLLVAANWMDVYAAALQSLANKRGITINEAAKLVFEVSVQSRKAEIDMLRYKLGELPSRAEDFDNVVMFPARDA